MTMHDDGFQVRQVPSQGSRSTLQGVSGLVKERMDAEASGRAAEARPMLLFPEVQMLL